MKRTVFLLAIVTLMGVVLLPATSVSARPVTRTTSVGAASGTVECFFYATVSFHHGLTTSGGATSPSKVKGSTLLCDTNDSSLEDLTGRITGSFDAGFGTGCSWNGGQPATLTISWKGRTENTVGDHPYGSKVSYAPSVVSYTGEQVVTDGSGDEGFALPGSANTSSVTGSFAASSDAGRSATVYSSLTPQAIATACSTKRGLKQLVLEGAITLGPGAVNPSSITTGPDGALWFTSPLGIDRMTTSGAFTHYTDPFTSPTDIITGPDGGLWFTNGGGDESIAYSSSSTISEGPNYSIDRISPSGVVTSYTDPSIASPNGITSGPDGALWFTNGGGESLNEDGTFTETQASIGRITTSGSVTNYIDPSVDAEPTDIITGPDGALWFTNEGSNSIGRITTAGAVTIYTSLDINGPTSITTGPDGALWYTNEGNDTIGRITTSGVTTTYTDPSISYPSSITTGPDGALWFTNTTAFPNILSNDVTLAPGSIGTITTSGVVTNYTDPSIDGPTSITTGPDGALWFTNSFDGSIGRITTSGAVTSYG